jgi:hypothetical protein
MEIERKFELLRIQGSFKVRETFVACYGDFQKRFVVFSCREDY